MSSLQSDVNDKINSIEQKEFELDEENTSHQVRDSITHNCSSCQIHSKLLKQKEFKDKTTKQLETYQPKKNDESTLLKTLANIFVPNMNLVGKYLTATDQLQIVRNNNVDSIMKRKNFGGKQKMIPFLKYLLNEYKSEIHSNKYKDIDSWNSDYFMVVYIYNMIGGGELACRDIDLLHKYVKKYDDNFQTFLETLLDPQTIITNIKRLGNVSELNILKQTLMTVKKIVQSRKNQKIETKQDEEVNTNEQKDVVYSSENNSQRLKVEIKQSTKTDDNYLEEQFIEISHAKLVHFMLKHKNKMIHYWLKQKSMN
eukprot:549272_1